MPYGMEFQRPDFGFISTAAGQMGQGIVDYTKAKKQEADIQLDETQAKNAHEDILNQVSKQYMEATGDTDPVHAITFAARYFPEKFKSETTAEAAQRWMNTEPKFKAALEELKVQKFHSDTAANQPQPYQRPEGKVEVTQPRAAAQPGTPEFSKNPTSFDGLAGMQARAMAEPLPSDIMDRPAETAQEKEARANALGVGEDKTVAKDIQSTQDIETGNDYANGQTRAQYLAGMAARGIDPTAGAAKAIADATPTEKDLMTDQRLRQAEEQRSKLRMTLARMQDARDRAKNLDKNTLKLLDTQIRAVQAQIDASKATSDLAMGIPTGKDYMGQTTYSTGPEWEKEYTDAETTYQSATALLEKIDALNKKINPSPADKPVTLPATMTANEKAAYEWLKNPASAKDPSYAAVREKLSRKYPDLVR